jgi:flagellar biosynthetic protein FlhB
VAQYIKRLAKENHITVVENKPLARALAANGKVGKAIPLELYAAVAEVLAFVYRARERRMRA